jgi:hypothetical protein
MYPVPLSGNLKATNFLRDIGVYERTILKQLLKKCSTAMWTKFAELVICINGGMSWILS